MSVRTDGDAIAWARRQHQSRSRNWTGMCQMFVRMSFNVGALYGSAATAWDNADGRHRMADGNKAPRGVPFYWKGGARGYGHVALSVGSGLCWSTDATRVGHVDLVRINDITRRWGQRPVGWTEDINNVVVWQRPTVSLADIMEAAERDPKRQTGGVTAGSVTDVLRVERALAARGYLSAKYVDGSYGTRTVEAMHRFQRDRGLKGNGLPTRDSVAAVVKGKYRLLA